MRTWRRTLAAVIAVAIAAVAVQTTDTHALQQSSDVISNPTEGPIGPIDTGPEPSTLRQADAAEPLWPSAGTPRVMAGPAKPEPRIINGSNLPDTEAPFLAGISRNGAPHCGGVLITLQVVLTAAHCVAGFDIATFQVGLGGSDRSNFEQTRAVVASAVHPGYSGDTSHDIAMLLLSSAVTATGNVDPATISVDAAFPFIGTTAAVAGWPTPTRPRR